MDNKDQGKNLVGEDSNISPENQLPLIWDNISKELNALDGDAVSMNEPTVGSDELSDVADFSIIKEGFQATFGAKEPPKFMWDKIEQDLESFTVTDAPSDFSAIKTGFEQNYKKAPAPNFTWAELAEEMDNPKPKEVVEDYTFVKRGFEKQYSAVVVPLFSWADLEQRMNYEAILADTPESYSIIKESFQEKYATHQPAANTWAALDEQLQAESHWKKALVFLMAPSFLKKAALFTAIGIFILGSKFYLLDDPTSFKIPSIIAGNEAAEAKAFSNKIKESGLQKAGSRSYAIEEEQAEHENLGTDQDQMNTALMPPENKYPRTKLRQGANTTSENKPTTEDISTLFGAANDENKPLDNEFINESGNNNNSLSPSLIDENKTKPSTDDLFDLEEVNKAAKDKQADLLRSNLKLLANRSNATWIGQDIMDVELLDDGLSILVQKMVVDAAIPKMEEESFPLVRQMQKGRKIRFEVGLAGKGGTSILLGQNTYDAWNSDQARMKMCPTGAFGLLANYHFSLKDAVVLGVYPYSTMEQCFGTYNNAGNYEETKFSLSLFDLTLGYQRTLIHYNSLRNVPSKVYARLDLGLGILTNAKTTINEAVINTADLYNKFNFSAGLSLGNAHEIKQFVIDYGITGNIGVNKLITETNPAILESANLLNIGAYLGVRYIIAPRLEPSKKQRQFDWSPPFYIEEPAF
jgi:hypothetical protein